MPASRPDPERIIRRPEDFAAAFDAPAETIDRLVVYERLLRQWQKAVNLVAPSTLDAIWHRHFADSAQVVALAPTGVRSWVDLGSGGGFPGLVAAIMMAGEDGRERPQKAPTCEGQNNRDGPAPERHGHAPGPQASNPLGPHRASGERAPAPSFTLIESDTRKCAFLREVVRQTGLSKAGFAVDILSRRAESASLSVNESLPRVVSARALAPLDRLFELALPFSPPGTTLLFLKGKEVETEVSQAKRHWQFAVALRQSLTDKQGRIAVVTNLERKAKD